MKALTTWLIVASAIFITTQAFSEETTPASAVLTAPAKPRAARTKLKKLAATEPRSIKLFRTNPQARPVELKAISPSERIPHHEGELSPTARSSVGVGLSFPIAKKALSKPQAPSKDDAQSLRE